MSRATRHVQQSQPVQNKSVPEINQSQGAPAMPRGQMPIEEVFKMMWARMNFLENALKESPTTNEDGVTTNEDGVTTISDLQDSPPNQIIRSHAPVPSYDDSVLEEIKSTLVEHDAKITTLAQEIGGLKKSLSDTIANFNNSMQAVGADLTEMNNKYTQMNNFLMEIQTTQITVNNQILKHYNDNYSDLIESQITQSADEKFNAKDNVEAASESVSEEVNPDTTEGEVANQNATATVESTLAQANENESNTETTTPVVENLPVTETKKNNVTFNIE
ncbi:MAG: hypothetical protein O2827_06645 [Verrucomicrobia bacterium]|nr:hypothetical protein [Verrucomicrobiota bacterium]